MQSVVRLIACEPKTSRPPIPRQAQERQTPAAAINAAAYVDLGWRDCLSKEVISTMATS